MQIIWDYNIIKLLQLFKGEEGPAIYIATATNTQHSKIMGLWVKQIICDYNYQITAAVYRKGGTCNLYSYTPQICVVQLCSLWVTCCEMPLGHLPWDSGYLWHHSCWVKVSPEIDLQVLNWCVHAWMLENYWYAMQVWCQYTINNYVCTLCMDQSQQHACSHQYCIVLCSAQTHLADLVPPHMPFSYFCHCSTYS